MDARDFVRERQPSGDEWAGVGDRADRVEGASHVDDRGADGYVLVAFEADEGEISRREVVGY